MSRRIVREETSSLSLRLVLLGKRPCLMTSKMARSRASRWRAVWWSLRRGADGIAGEASTGGRSGERLRGEGFDRRCALVRMSRQESDP